MARKQCGLVDLDIWPGAQDLNLDIWLSTEVPFGIVKLADAEDKGIELTAFGSDAKPGITTAPQQIPGMDP